MDETLHREDYRLEYVEACLREYPDNLKAIRERRAWLEAVHSPSQFEPRIGGAPSMPSAPQERAVMFFEGDDILATLEHKTAPITAWVNSASLMDIRVVTLRYFDRKPDGRRRTWQEVAGLLHISEDHARGYVRKRILENIMIFFREVNTKPPIL